MAETALQTYGFGRFRFDAATGRLFLDGGEIPLKSRELQLLTILVEHPEEWMRDEWLAHALWPRALAPQSELDHLVRELSTILARGADGVATIQSQKERGHRLQIPVHRLDAAKPAPSPALAPLPGDRTVRLPPPPPPPPRVLPEAGSGHRRLLAPKRFALVVIGAALAALAIGWLLRWATHRAERLAPAISAESDPGVVRAAASTELAKGISAARGYDLAALDEAIDRFEAAIAIEPGYAEARGALAEALVRRGSIAPARREAEVALKLQPDLAPAQAALAFVQLFASWKPGDAKSSAERALLLEITQPTARRALAWSLLAEGKAGEALVEIRRSLQPGVLDPESATDECWILFLSGRALEARQLAAEVVRVAPTFAPSREILGYLHLLDRRLGPAAIELELRDRLLEGATSRDDRIRLAIVGGLEPPDAGEAARLLRARADASYRGVARDAELEKARILTQLGDRDAALAALERAIARREGGIVVAWLDPSLAVLRPTPRFRELMTRAGVAAPAAR